MLFFRFYGFIRVVLTIGAGVLSCFGILSAQAPTWRVPSSGYIYDASQRSVRSVNGLIGAAVLGPSLIDSVDWLSVAPNGKSAMIERSGSLNWLPDLGAPDRSQSLDRSLNPRQAFWASDSGQAVLLTTSSQLVWLTNLNSAPAPKARWTLERPASRVRVAHGTGWILLAADSAAERVLLAYHAGEHWQLWLASSTSPPVLLQYSGHPAAALFIPGGAGALVADIESHQIVRFESLDAAPVTSILVSSPEFIDDLAGMALSGDGKRLVVADGADKTIRFFDYGTGALMGELPADEVPTSLTSFAPDLFLLNAGLPANEPLFLVDTGTPAKVSFVPRGE
jgi:WD40 repeat protein